MANFSTESSMGSTGDMRLRAPTSGGGSRQERGIRTPAARRRPPKNVGQSERWGSALGGAAVLLAGLRRGRASGMLLGLLGGSLLYRGLTGHCHGYDALGINTADHPDATAIPAQQGVKVERTVRVDRSATELYHFWRNFENLPQVMKHLERVDRLDESRSRWVAQGPMGIPLSWEAEVYNESEPEMIAWRSLPGSQVDTAGSVHFKALDAGQGTDVSISLKYNPPMGKLAATVASFLGSGLEQKLDDDLRRFKSLMESGPVPHRTEAVGGASEQIP